MLEEWRDAKGYEGYYQVSNLGRVKSLDRYISYTKKKARFYPSKILVEMVNSSKYPFVNLYKKNSHKTTEIHKIVWDAFGDEPSDGRRLQIDHIDNDKTNNHINNLRLVSTRTNCAKRSMQYPKSSEYTGVCYDKRTKMWVAQIRIEKSSKSRNRWLGRHKTELQAHLAYQKVLLTLGNI